VNEIAYRQPVSGAAHGLEEAVAPRQDNEALLGEEAVRRITAELRHEINQQIEWQMQQQRAVRGGPSPTEMGLVLGSLATGAVVTAVLVANTTIVVSGLFGAQNVTHLDTFPLIVIVWLALVAINWIWARRR
jgi:hypothetical protein